MSFEEIYPRSKRSVTLTPTTTICVDSSVRLLYMGSGTGLSSKQKTVARLLKIILWQWPRFAQWYPIIGVQLKEWWPDQHVQIHGQAICIEAHRHANICSHIHVLQKRLEKRWRGEIYWCIWDIDCPVGAYGRWHQNIWSSQRSIPTVWNRKFFAAWKHSSSPANKRYQPSIMGSSLSRPYPRMGSGEAKRGTIK